MLAGDINALSDPSAILIDASMSKTLFGDADPMGKIIRLDNKDNFTVAGVYRDFPANSTFYEAKFFLPWSKYINQDQWVKDVAMDWSNQSWLCFAQLADNIDMDKESDKIRNIEPAV